MKRDVWKDVKGYKGLYKINREGVVINKRGKVVGTELSQRGYVRVRLYKNNVKKNHKVHRLVAQAFIPNPRRLSQIDHINGDKTDNRVQNLRWMDNRENNNAFKSEHLNKQPVVIIGCFGEILRYFSSLREAASAIGVSRHGISAACRGLQKTSGGYSWRFVTEAEFALFNRKAV
jgi:hypothetical protein